MMRLKVVPALFALALGVLIMDSASSAVLLSPVQRDSYVTDGYSEIAVSGQGNCLRTTVWSKKGAVQKCDPEFFKNPVIFSPYRYIRRTTESPVPVKRKMTFAAGTFFDTDSARLRPSAKHVLDQLVTSADNVSLEVVIATGYTDSRGSRSHNLKLSEQRAEAVKTYLVAKHTDPNSVYAEGRGEENPIGNNDTVAGRARNRRVDVEVIGTTTKDLSNLTTSFTDNSDTKDSSVKKGKREEKKHPHSLKKEVHAATVPH